MKQLEHARLPTPEKSRKSIRDCEDIVGPRPLECPVMFADAAGSVHHIDAAYTVGGVSW